MDASGVGVAAGVTVVSSAETGSYVDSSLGYGALFAGIGAGLAIYAIGVWLLRVPEARQIRRLLVSRGRSGG